MTLRLRYDRVADAAYIYVKHPIASGEVAETVPVEVSAETPVGSGINLDFGKNGMLLGVEILGASKVLPPELLIDSAPER